VPRRPLRICVISNEMAPPEMASAGRFMVAMKTLSMPRLFRSAVRAIAISSAFVSPEDGDQYEDLKPLTRRLMERMEQDLGTKLDWVAVDHFNTGHPHTHILVRGKDDGGKDLVIAKDYMTRGCASAPSSWSISIWGRALSVRSKPFCGQRWRRSG
jgi:hypothetical protein